jgi:hypothetical protein
MKTATQQGVIRIWNLAIPVIWKISPILGENKNRKKTSVIFWTYKIKCNILKVKTVDEYM